MKYNNKNKKNYPWVFECLERDNQTCVDCGSIDESKKKWSNLVVHHIDNSRNTGNLNNNLDNLVTLCKSCHSKRHYHCRL